MKKTYIFMTAIAVFFCAFLFSPFFQTNSSKKRLKHQYFLKNSPFRATTHLSKKDRKAKGLPPNAYHEMLWERTINPNTGRTEPEKLLKLQKQFQHRYKTTRQSRQEEEMIWAERGPANLGGRTRALCFDPNDVGGASSVEDYTRVFAGGVSGGLWVNEDITDPNSSWTQVSGVLANIAITKIIFDPNNTNIMYLATGESYTNGQALGNGVWKSTDRGNSWTHIFGGYHSIDEDNKFIDGIFYINDIVARDIGNETELYISVSGSYFQYSGALPQFHSANNQGLYKSIDNGNTWQKIGINESSGKPINPNDIELDLNNNIWLTTTRNYWGESGGKIYKSNNGVQFELKYEGEDGMGRTELEPSKKDPNTFWVLLSHWNQAELYTTSDSFNTISRVSTEPNDADPDISEEDFTRGQAFYDLVIEVNANDDLFVGGIDLFRSNDKANTWTQISHWYGGNNLQYVHADQHAITFRPGYDNQAVFGNDGGIYFCNNLQLPANEISIKPRNKAYNTAQFYYGSIDKNPSTGLYVLAGGTQDNGSWAHPSTPSTVTPFQNILGGDGGFTETDAADNYMIVSYIFDEHLLFTFPGLLESHPISAGNEKGSFINTAVLDKTLDIFYHDSSQGNTYELTRSSNFKNNEAEIVKMALSNPMFDDTPSALTVSPFESQKTLLCMGLVNGKLLVVDNANATPSWTNISGTEFLGSISDITFGATKNELFVTFHNYGVKSIWHTTDFGETWTSIEGNLPDLPVRCLLQNPKHDKELIIGTPLGIWETKDYNNPTPQWTSQNNLLSNVSVVDLDLKSNDSTILATTHGRGFFTAQFHGPKSEPSDAVTSPEISIYPTVSRGTIKIVSNEDFGQASLNMFNMAGQWIYGVEFEAKKGQNKEVSLQLSSGLYLVKIQTKNHRFTEKIIIK